MEGDFYSDWFAMEETHDYYCPIEAQIVAELEAHEAELGLAH